MIWLRAFILLAFVCAVQSFSVIRMGGAAGVATTRKGKQATIESTKALLEESSFLFGISVEGMTVKQTETLRRSMPADTTFKIVKNRLLKKAAEGTPFEAINPAATQMTGWVFVKEDIKDSVNAYLKFTKDVLNKKEFSFNGGVLDGDLLDAKGVEGLKNMLSKTELYAKIGVGIRAIPTKIGKGIKLVPHKIGKGINLALVHEKEE